MNNLECSWSTCSATFSSENEIKDHYKMKHSISQTSSYKCALCYMTFSRPDSLERHQHVKHSVKNVELQNVNFDNCSPGRKTLHNIKSKRNLNKRKNKIYTCSLCSVSFNTKIIFKQHLKIKHNDSKTTEQKSLVDVISGNSECYESLNYRPDNFTSETENLEYCTRKKFFYKYFLNQQIHDISISKETNETKCSDSSDLKQCIKKEYDDIFQNQNCKRSVCEKKSVTVLGLNEHQENEHEDDFASRSDSFECPICRKQFAKKTVRRRHIIHLHMIQEKVHECPVCHMKFNRGDSLKRHQRIKHNAEDINLKKEVFECDICGKTFFYKVSVERHLQCTHMPKEKLHSCTKCNATFTYLYGLKRHFRTKHSTSSEADYECAVCGMKFRRRDNLKRHQAVHESKNYECPTCHLRFNRLDSLKQHEKKKHFKNEADAEFENFICYHCEKNFAAKSCVKQHIVNMHLSKRNKEISLSRNKCSMCDAIFRLRSDLLFHYQKDHDVQVESENIGFGSFAEFIDWKKKMEKQTWCAYNRLFTRRRHAQIEVMTYICHRSGVYTPVSQRKRRLKQQGSKKIGALCPAELKLTVNKDGTCEVKYTKTHVGHEVHSKELVHVRHHPDERNLIASKIAAGVSYSRIMKDMTNNLSSETTENMEKIHLLTRADIRNIAFAKKLNRRKCGQLIDELDIESFIEQYGDTVLYYKKVHEMDEHRELTENDFVLIIMSKEQKCVLKNYAKTLVAIDGTYGCSRYGYVLQSLMVLDEKREAFPCCFMFSNRNDETLVDVMLECVSNEVGPIITDVLLTDVHEMYYNSWVRIMKNEPSHKLFSPWHVKRAWRKYFTKIECSQKRKAISRLLCNNLLVDSDRDEFEKKLKQFLDNDDTDASSFKQYFKEHFVETKMRWAFCYRVQAGIEENIKLESFHYIIKNIYTEGNKIRNLRDALQILLCYMNDKMNQMEEAVTFCDTDAEKFEDVYVLPSFTMADENENENENLDEELQTTFIIEGDDSEFMVEQLQQKYIDCQLYCKECNASSCPHIDSLCSLFSVEANKNVQDKIENIILPDESSSSDEKLKSSILLEDKRLRCKEKFLEMLNSSTEQEVESLIKIFTEF